MSDALSQPEFCPLCRGNAEPMFEPHSWPLQEGGRAFRYAHCRACETMFAVPQPTAEEIDWLYRHRYDYTWFIQRKGFKRIQASHRWRRLRAIFGELKISTPSRRMLDIGGGHAWFLRAAQTDGWTPEGLELLNDELVSAAKTHGITMHHGSLLAHSLPAETFALVTAWHVLEHVPAVRDGAAAIADLVMPGGIAVIAVPNFHAAGMSNAGLAWVWCQKPFIHPWHLSATTLQMLLPPSLEILLVTSRDTWDAQWAESTTPYRFAMKAIYAGALWGRKGAAKLSWQAGVRLADRLQFWAEEALRLVTYGGYLLLRPFLRRSYEMALRGSELLVVARKKKAA